MIDSYIDSEKNTSNISINMLTYHMIFNNLRWTY